MTDLPRLRGVEVYPVSSNGTKAFCVRDPEGYQEDPIFLSPQACLVAVMLDGRSTMRQIQETFVRAFQGQALAARDIFNVIETLDECFLLDTERFAKQKARLDAAFEASKVRDAYLASRGYPKEPKALGEFLDEFYLDPKGPGSRPRATSKAALAGLMVPHIDFHRGGWCYAHGYKALAEAEVPKRILLLGVAHAGSPVPFVFCRKSYRTPLGEMPLDEEGLSQLELLLDHRVFEYEALHRTEHSLEFQAVWLAHIYARLGVRFPPIIPVLAASFGEDKQGYRPQEEAERVIEAMKKILMKPGTLVLAGVDLAHVGPRFGDPEPLDEALASRTRSADEASLSAVTQGNARGFWSSVTADGNKRKVCGLTAIYTALRLLEGKKGKLDAYGQALDPAGGYVSFASVRFAA